MTQFRDIAEEYVDKEIAVMPIDGEKRAFIPRWTRLTYDTVLNDINNLHWKKAQGLGLICGEPSGVIALDIDITIDESNKEKLIIRDKLLKKLPPIYSARLGSRQKPATRFFKYTGELNEKFKNIDIEILSDGAHCVLPPTVHVSGEPYEYVEKSLLEIDIDDLPELNEDIIVWLREQNMRLKGEYSADKLLRSVQGRCKSGSHNRLSSIGVAMRLKNKPFDEVVARLIEEDKSINRNEDSLYFSCKSRKWRSSRAEVNAQTFVDEIFDRNEPEKVSVNYPSLDQGFFIEIETKQGVKKVPDYKGMAEYFKEELKLKAKEKSNYIYNGEYYEPIERLGLENKAYELTNMIANPTHIGNFVKTVRSHCYYKDEFTNPLRLLNMKSGILDTDSLEIMPRDDHKFFTYRLEYDVDLEKKAQVFEDFLELVATGDDQKKTVIKEYIGYILSGCPYDKFQKILILDGGGSNGKTTLINIIQMLIGANNYSSEDLVSLKEHRFSKSSLVGKLANFCAEEPKQAFSASGILKRLTGNDPVMAEFKHQGAFAFVNFAKFIISYNEIPFMPDRTSGMQRRLIIVPCITDLEKNPELKIKNILPKIQKELGAIAADCLSAYKKVEDRGYFTEVEAGVNRFEEIILQSDPILDFIKQRVNYWHDMSLEARNEYLDKTGQILEKYKDDYVPKTYTSTLWFAFEKFMGNRHSFTRRSFETRIATIFKDVPNVCKSSKEKNEKRGWDGIIVESDQ